MGKIIDRVRRRQDKATFIQMCRENSRAESAVAQLRAEIPAQPLWPPKHKPTPWWNIFRRIDNFMAGKA